ncbi:Gtpase activating protein, partial [Coemansia sp. RSA 2618]
QIEHFTNIGNQRANAYFNPHADRHPAPRSDRDVERYIRDKYERRLFVDRNSGVADPSVIGASAAAALARPGATGVSGEAAALTRLHELGFTDVRANHAALQQSAHDVERAAALLRGDTGGRGARVRESDPRVKQLLNMGFSSAAQNAHALEACAGDVNRAIELLLSDNAPPRSAAKAPLPPAKSPQVPPKSPSDLLDGDFFGSAPAPTSPSKPAALNDLLGGLSLTEAAAPAASTVSAAPAPSAVQDSNDLFGDFGDFLSAGPEQPSQSAVATTALPAASKPAVASRPTAAAPANPPSHGGQSIIDTSFIMSLYSKPSPSTNTAPATSTSNDQKPNSGFNDLDFFM